MAGGTLVAPHGGTLVNRIVDGDRAVPPVRWIEGSAEEAGDDHDSRHLPGLCWTRNILSPRP